LLSVISPQINLLGHIAALGSGCRSSIEFKININRDLYDISTLSALFSRSFFFSYVERFA